MTIYSHHDPIVSHSFPRFLSSRRTGSPPEGVHPLLPRSSSVGSSYLWNDQISGNLFIQPYHPSWIFHMYIYYIYIHILYIYYIYICIYIYNNYHNTTTITTSPPSQYHYIYMYIYIYTIYHHIASGKLRVRPWTSPIFEWKLIWNNPYLRGSIYGVTDITHVMQQNLYQERWHLQSIEMGFHQRLSTARSFEGPCSCTCRIMRKTMENPKNRTVANSIIWNRVYGYDWNDVQRLPNGSLQGWFIALRLPHYPLAASNMVGYVQLFTHYLAIVIRSTIYLIVRFFENCNFPVNSNSGEMTHTLW